MRKVRCVRCSNSSLLLKWSHLHSNTCRFLWTCKSYSNGLLAILKNTLEPEQWTNRNQEFTQWTNRKQRGPQRNSVVISPINVSSPICFHLNRMGNDNDNISPEEYFENSKTSRGTVLIYYQNCSFLSKFKFYLVTQSLNRNCLG
jgi:hypothetical protein